MGSWEKMEKAKKNKNKNYEDHNRMKKLKRSQSCFFFPFLLDFFLPHSWGKPESCLQGPFKGRSERRSKLIQDKSDILIVQKEVACWGSD